MTERFSEEYGDFAANSEAIQAEWQKRGVRVGDWLLVKASEWITPIDDFIVLIPHLDEIGSYGISGVTQYFEQYPEGQAYRWLPTLSDLLDGLENVLPGLCGYALTFNEHESDIGRVYRCYEITPLEWLEALHDSPCEDRELAAARLFVRVLAGKEERA